MNRPIKFRAWDTESKQMVSSKQAVSTIVAREIRGASEGHLNGNGHVEPGQYMILQFTGLTDKNGKEIYEGDVVYGSVGYAPTNLEVKWFGEGHGNCWYPFNRTKGTKVEVIGNIYENPELLKV